MISSLAKILAETLPRPSSQGMNLEVWKYVVIIGVVAVVIFWGVKRVSDVVVKKKTEDMIKKVGEDE